MGLPVLRRTLEAVPPYATGGPPGPKEVRLDHNESPHRPPAAVLRAVEAAARGSNRYPDPDHRRLKRALSEYTGLPEECISAGVGASGVLDTLSTLTLEPLERAVIPVPSYGMYGFLAMLRGATPQYVESEEEFRVEPDRVAEAAGGARVVFLCSPNNPTGAATPERDLLAIVESTDALVVVDEAYHEFSGRTVASRVQELENLVVVRSLSKFFSLAGLRVGYALAHPRVAESMERCRLPFNLSNVAQAAAVAALGQQDLFRRRCRGIVRERERLRRSITRIPGVRAFPSEANFLLLHAGGPGLAGKLAERRIRVRDLADVVGLGPGYLRVTVGSKEENSRFVQALRRSVESLRNDSACAT